MSTFLAVFEVVFAIAVGVMAFFLLAYVVVQRVRGKAKVKSGERTETV